MRKEAIYRWEVQTLHGSLTTSEVVASSRLQARRQLITRGEIPINLQHTISINTRSWRDKELPLFTRQLATLLGAGIKIHEALRLADSGEKSAVQHWLLQRLQQGVSSGLSFSQALQRQPLFFDQLYCTVVAVGELTGQLEKSCWQLTLQQEKAASLRQQTRRALVYPSLTLLLALVITLLIFILVAPTFEQLYHGLNLDLPTVTRVLLRSSRALRYSPALSICLPMALIVSIAFSYRLIPCWQRRWQQILLLVPGVGPLLHLLFLARLTRILELSQSSSVDILQGLEAAAVGCGSWSYQQAILAVAEGVRCGLSLYSSFQRQAIFPPLLYRMVQIGEEGNSLEASLNYAANFYEQAATEQGKVLVKLIEPLAILLVGTIVAALVLAIYLPIFRLGEVIH